MFLYYLSGSPIFAISFVNEKRNTKGKLIWGSEYYYNFNESWRQIIKVIITYRLTDFSICDFNFSSRVCLLDLIHNNIVSI